MAQLNVQTLHHVPVWWCNCKLTHIHINIKETVQTKMNISSFFYYLFSIVVVPTLYDLLFCSTEGGTSYRFGMTQRSVFWWQNHFCLNYPFNGLAKTLTFLRIYFVIVLYINIHTLKKKALVYKHSYLPILFTKASWSIWKLKSHMHQYMNVVKSDNI